MCVNINKADVNIVVLHVDTKKVIYVNIIMLYVDRDNYHVNIQLSHMLHNGNNVAYIVFDTGVSKQMNTHKGWFQQVFVVHLST